MNAACGEKVDYLGECLVRVISLGVIRALLAKRGVNFFKDRRE